MSVEPSADARRILELGSFCHVASSTRTGPHVTPMVFALAGDRIWVTTSRGSVKARAWSLDPRVAGVVRAGSESVAFAGRAVTYDLLDPGSWGRSLREAPLVSLAAARFTMRNARFFAGYAVDAHEVPFAWTPPGRVFAELRLEELTVFRDGRPVGAGRARRDAARSSGSARHGRATLRSVLYRSRWPGRWGRAEPACWRSRPPVAPPPLPAAWVVEGGGLYAMVAEAALARAGIEGASAEVALGMDRPSTWRARDMVGAMARGEAELFAAERLTSGRTSAARILALAGVDLAGTALVRIRPRSFVWWRGWSSGTVAAPVTTRTETAP